MNATSANHINYSIVSNAIKRRWNRIPDSESAPVIGEFTEEYYNDEKK